MTDEATDDVTDGATRRETVPTDAGDARVTWYEPDAGPGPGR